ncbi:MAG: DUF6666 family protein [Planctomycetota bacterium]
MTPRRPSSFSIRPIFSRFMGSLGAVVAVSAALAHSPAMAQPAALRAAPRGHLPGGSMRGNAPSAGYGFVPKHEQWAESMGWRKNDQFFTAADGDGLEGTEERATAGPQHGGLVENGDLWDAGGFLCGDLCRADLRNLQLLGGVQAFTGPMNRGAQGSFGFYEGVNYGAPIALGIPLEIGWQAGFRATQSNLSGSDFTTDSRQQFFATGGLFHRVDRGLQWAIGYDWSHNDWYVDTDLGQLRGEISWKASCDHEAGLMFAIGNTTDTDIPVFRPSQSVAIETWETTDWYAGFYRHSFGASHENSVRAFVGFTGQSDALLGADALVAINSAWAVQGGLTFMAPSESSGPGIHAGHAQESWNLAVGIVWTPGCATAERGYYTPLLNVADNGSLLVDWK